MDSEKLKQIEEIYHAALDIAAAERDELLDKLCGTDEYLRGEVESLLSFDEAPENFIDESPESLAAEMFSRPPDKPGLIGETIGHYRITRLLGIGGMGEVYLAEDTKLARRVALKILPETFVGDNDRMGRFIREARTVSALNHPNIITIYEINESDGLNLIVTEYIDGKTLKETAGGKPMRPRTVLKLAIQIASALDEARNGADNLKKAIEYQNQAVALDPDFAQAYAELAFNYGALVEISAIDPADGKPKARAAAEKAVALDDSLAEAHLALAYIENQDLNWSKAGENIKRAIELNPNYASAHTLYAAYLSQIGRFDEALAEIKQSQKLDPLRPGLIGNEGIILYYARRYAEAIIKMQEGLRPEPENAPARVYLGQAYTADRQYKQALNELKIADKTDSESTSALIFLGQANALAGNHAEATAILSQLQSTKKYVSPGAMAIFYAALGDKNSAFRSLEKAYAERDTQLQSLKVEPGFDPLRGDRRFADLLKRTNLPE